MDKEIYYAIINILDYIEGENSIDKIRSIADANNCGVCDSFEKIIMSFQEQYELGERI